MACPADVRGWVARAAGTSELLLDSGADDGSDSDSTATSPTSLSTSDNGADTTRGSHPPAWATVARPGPQPGQQTAAAANSPRAPARAPPQREAVSAVAPLGPIFPGSTAHAAGLVRHGNGAQHATATGDETALAAHAAQVEDSSAGGSTPGFLVSTAAERMRAAIELERRVTPPRRLGPSPAGGHAGQRGRGRGRGGRGRDHAATRGPQGVRTAPAGPGHGPNGHDDGRCAASDAVGRIAGSTAGRAAGSPGAGESGRADMARFAGQGGRHMLAALVARAVGGSRVSGTPPPVGAVADVGVLPRGSAAAARAGEPPPGAGNAAQVGSPVRSAGVDGGDGRGTDRIGGAT